MKKKKTKKRLTKKKITAKKVYQALVEQGVAALEAAFHDSMIYGVGFVAINSKGEFKRLNHSEVHTQLELIKCLTKHLK